MAVEWVFRDFPHKGDPIAGRGEVLIYPRHASDPEALTAVASLVLKEEKGQGLLRGPGRVKRLVVLVTYNTPSFDDMLAATFLSAQLDQKSLHALLDLGGTRRPDFVSAPPKEGRLPAGCAAFARYAELWRQGHRPSDTIPPELSLEGIYQDLVTRCTQGKDQRLTNPDVANRFLKHWARLAACILRAAEAGLDPFAVSPVADDPEFAHERKSIAKDRPVYGRDVRRGERWRVSLPGENAADGYGLFLRRPASRLFKYWCRGGELAPGPEGYLFMAVNWGEGVWMFSTDPADHLPIATLAGALQAAEGAKKAALAGEPAPGADSDLGTGRAAPGDIRPPRPAAWRRLLFWRRGPAVAPPEDPDPWWASSDGTFVRAPRAGTVLSEGAVLATVKRWAAAEVLPAAGRAGGRRGATALALAACLVLALGSLLYLGASPDNRSALANLVFSTGRSGGEGPPPTTPHEITRGPRDRKPALYLLTVGVSKYALKNRRSERDVPYAATDARGVHDVFSARANFFGVRYHVPLVDEKATRKDVGNALKALKNEVLRAQLDDDVSPQDLVVVTFAGHGGKYGDDYFCFLTSGYDPANQVDQVFSWPDVKALLTGLPCTVVVLMDTCHSGVTTRPGQMPYVGSGAENETKMVVIAACFADQAAGEDAQAKHGILTEAFLEAVTGQFQLPPSWYTRQPGDRTSLAELLYYVPLRVKYLALAQQYPAYSAERLKSLPLQVDQVVSVTTTGNIDGDNLFVGGRTPTGGAPRVAGASPGP